MYPNQSYSHSYPISLFVIMLGSAGFFLDELADWYWPTATVFMPMAIPAFVKRFRSTKILNREQEPHSSPSRNPQAVTTKTLSILINRDTQTLSGEVISGPFTGAVIDEMTGAQLINLLNYCRRRDRESCRLLYYTYIYNRVNYREFADEALPPPQQQDNLRLGEADARGILGVSAKADRREIVAAHRRLMSIHHPDRGGDEYMAARINQAKDTLLPKRG